MDHLAGAALEDAPPVAMADDAFDAIMARIGETKAKPTAAAMPTPSPQVKLLDDDLPEALRRCQFGKQRRVAPGVKMQPIILPGAVKSRAFLLWSAPGTKMLEHSPTDTELTLVLKGSFSHEGGDYRPGDFDFGDDHVDHQPIVGGDEPVPLPRGHERQFADERLVRTVDFALRPALTFFPSSSDPTPRRLRSV